MSKKLTDGGTAASYTSKTVDAIIDGDSNIVGHVSHKGKHVRVGHYNGAKKGERNRFIEDMDGNTILQVEPTSTLTDADLHEVAKLVERRILANKAAAEKGDGAAPEGEKTEGGDDKTETTEEAK